ncbi:MAG: helix-turn-helix domain-containing protein [Patescibacteria group bacterium]
MKQNRFLSTSEVAKLLGISRIAVFKKIKAGHIEAKKIGRVFVIDKKDLPEILGEVLSKNKKHEIEAAVTKTMKEYGETLRLLGQE